MKTFYSIVSISTKPFFSEKIGVGLLCVNKNQVYFHFSGEKLKWISKLLTKDAKNQALNSLRAIDRIVKENSVSTNFLNSGTTIALSENYIHYLSRYNNNLVQFSSPMEIDLDLDESVFQKLFKKYIHTEEQFNFLKVEKRNSYIEDFKTNFKPRISRYVNTDYTVNNEIIQGLIAPITVDLFGKNGAFVTGQTIDFSKEKRFLSKDVSSYMYLALTTEMADKGSKCFLLGDEPSKELSFNHQIWDNARKHQNIDFVPISESERIVEFLKEKGVIPIQ